MKIRYTLCAAAALGLLSSAASAVDWGGYARVGPGQKQNSGDGKRCYEGGAQGGHGGIGRLGNECNTYFEFALSETTDVGGVKYKALMMSNYFNPGSEVGGEKLGVNQIYVEGTGYDIAPNQTFWIGKRFYHRADVHMDDLFVVNMTGTGAGVDGFGIAGGKLSFAVFRSDDDDVPNAGTRYNVDLESVPINPGGKLRLTAAVTDFSGVGGENGLGLSLQHNQTGLFLGADNTLWVQWTRGSAYLDMGFGGALDGSGVKRFRIADSLAWLKGPLTAQTLFQVGREERAGATEKWYGLAGRAAYALTTNFKLQGELGFASNKPEGQSKRNVTKITVAPTLTVGPDYYDRPELRFYVSHFRFNDAYRIAQGQTKKNKTALGFQAEIWF